MLTRALFWGALGADTGDIEADSQFTAALSVTDGVLVDEVGFVFDFFQLISALKVCVFAGCLCGDWWVGW